MRILSIFRVIIWYILLLIPLHAQAMQQTEMEEIAEKFEAQILAHVLKQIYPQSMDAINQKSSANKIMRDLLLDEYGKVLAKKQSIGIAKNIKRDLARKTQALKKEE